MTLFLLIAAVLVALGVSALCSLLEAALLSLTPGQVSELKKRRPKVGRIWEGFKAEVEKPISVILICNTAAHTIGATVAGAEFEALMRERGMGGGFATFLFGAVFTVLMLQFTEILPKTLGVKYNRFVAAFSGRPLNFLVWAMGPVLWATRLINRPFERRGEGQGRNASADVEEIATLAALARHGRSITEQQERMIKMAARLGDVRVRQVMTPRKDVHFLREGDPVAKTLETLRTTPYTRLPLCGPGGLDEVRGMVHLKDLFIMFALVPGRMALRPDPSKPDEVLAVPEDRPGGELHVIGSGQFDLSKAVRPVAFVPDSQPLDQLLDGLRSGASHLAVVVDEYGATLGLVTLEDVLEELVGDIEDEFDEGEHVWQLRPVEDESGAWLCEGEVPLREVADRLDIDAETLGEGGVVTLGGFVTRELSRFPKEGDVVELVPGWEVRVERVERGHVSEATLLHLAGAGVEEA